MVTLSGTDLIELLDFISPDREQDPEQLESEVTIIQKQEAFTSTDGEDRPAGLYAFLTECPEEGLYGPIGARDLLKVALFTMQDGEPWGLWASGHHRKADFLIKANEVIAGVNYAPVTIDQVEHGHAYYDSGLPECNLMEAEQGQPGAFPITWVRGDMLTYPGE
ncbi:TPA: hypothetical protein I8273_004417 [Aeromonas hydrophila]|nr:hypothetical protein [Aeromonas hydrophila]HAT2638883.1 hypothetical protein [Aeromonas hydrophila]HAT3423983.1 hypothetical protein [Aeromonas hydrophila]HAT3534019.1 hypothetical protein [Aeromonas hydrophila]